MIDFANALQLLGADHVTDEQRDVLLPFLRNGKRSSPSALREGFKSLLDDGARFAREDGARRRDRVMKWLLSLLLLVLPAIARAEIAPSIAERCVQHYAISTGCLWS